MAYMRLARRGCCLGTPVKYFCLLFQGGAYFVDHLCNFFLAFVNTLYAFVCVCLLMLCGHLLGKGWPLGSRL